MPDDDMTHYIFSFGGVGHPVNPGVLAVQVGNALAEAGVDLAFLLSYTSPTFKNPDHLSLRRAWDNMAPMPKGALRGMFPELTHAIDLITGTEVKSHDAS